VNDLRALLGNRSFARIWAAAVVSGLGDKIAVIAFYLLIFKLTGRPLDLGLLAAAQIVPAIVLGPITGVILDRYDRRRVMIAAEVASAGVVASVPLADSCGAVYLLAGLLSAGRQFSGPARLALLPDLVPSAQLDRANALLMVTRNVVLLVGPAVGGAIVAWRGTDPAFWTDAATFLLSAALLAAGPLIHLPDATVAAGSGRPRSTVWQQLRAGFDVVWGYRRLRFAVLFFAALTFVTAMQQPLVVLLVKTRLGGSDLDLGLIVSAAGVGGIAGALAGGLLRAAQRPLRTVTWLLAVDGLLLVVFAFNRQFVPAVVLFALFGAIGTVIQISIATFLQREAPVAHRGRVFGWLGTFIGPVSLASVFVGPALAEVVGVVAVLAAAGLFEIAVGLTGRWRLPPAPTRPPPH
jgi:MFS family permease